MAHSKKILVIDDEDDVRNYLKTALEDSGFEVATACNGEEGMNMVKNSNPDLISLDLVMPKHSGIKFYHWIQKEKDFKKIPILIVTGHARDELGKADFEEMTMQGIGVYLEKPVKPDKYVSTICGMLGLESPIFEEVKDETLELKKQLAKSMEKADPETLKKALEALNKK